MSSSHPSFTPSSAWTARRSCCTWATSPTSSPPGQVDLATRGLTLDAVDGDRRAAAAARISARARRVRRRAVRAAAHARVRRASTSRSWRLAAATTCGPRSAAGAFPTTTVCRSRCSSRRQPREVASARRPPRRRRLPLRWTRPCVTLGRARGRRSKSSPRLPKCPFPRSCAPRPAQRRSPSRSPKRGRARPRRSCRRHQSLRRSRFGRRWLGAHAVARRRRADRGSRRRWRAPLRAATAAGAHATGRAPRRRSSLRPPKRRRLSKSPRRLRSCCRWPGTRSGPTRRRRSSSRPRPGSTGCCGWRPPAARPRSICRRAPARRCGWTATCRRSTARRCSARTTSSRCC